MAMDFNLANKVGFHFKKVYGGYVFGVFPNHTFADVIEELEQLATYLVENEKPSTLFIACAKEFAIPRYLYVEIWNEKKKAYLMYA